MHVQVAAPSNRALYRQRSNSSRVVTPTSVTQVPCRSGRQHIDFVGLLQQAFMQAMITETARNMMCCVSEIQAMFAQNVT